jgi:hypothetical protein
MRILHFRCWARALTRHLKEQGFEKCDPWTRNVVMSFQYRRLKVSLYGGDVLHIICDGATEIHEAVSLVSAAKIIQNARISMEQKNV